MCGITGWVDFGRDLRGEGERAAIEAMTATMICRGPDAGGTWCSAHAAIGHRRLSVIDLAGGAQPMRAAWRRRRRADLQRGDLQLHRAAPRARGAGHEFRTRSDTEVLLHGYLEWGADCVRRLNGMFAFGVWDGRAAGTAAGPRPAWREAAVLRGAAGWGAVRVGAEGHPGAPGVPRRDRRRRAGRTVQPGRHRHARARRLPRARPRSGRARWYVVGRGGDARVRRTGGSRPASTPMTWRPRPARSGNCSPTSCTGRPSPTCRCAACCRAASTPAWCPRSPRTASARRDRAKLATFSVDFAGSARCLHAGPAAAQPRRAVRPRRRRVHRLPAQHRSPWRRTIW